MDKKKEIDETGKLFDSLRIKAPSLETKLFTLSGGNQQKVILGKWLLNDPKILFVDEPTKGIDVGTKADFYTLLSDLASQGVAIVMVSSDMPELISMSDRCLVLSEGRLTAELKKDEINETAVMRAAISSGGGDTMANRANSGFVEFPCKKLDVHTHLATVKNDRGMFTAEERIAFDQFYGVDRCVLLPMADGFPDGPAMTGMMTPLDASAICEKYPEHFSWFCNITPDGTDATWQKLKRYKEMGAKGVGEFGGLMRFDDPIMEHMFSCCEKLGLPFLFHMSPNGINYGVIDEAGLPLLEGALKKFPGLAFIGHSQPFWFEISQYPADLTAEERNIYPRGKVIPGRVPYLLETYANLYADLSADSGGNALIRDEEYAIEFLGKFRDKLMFGSDVASANFIYPVAFYLDSLLHQDKISDEVYVKICRGNAEKLLGI